MKDRIKQLMESRRMSQSEFSAYTGISAPTLSGIFAGRTKPTMNIVDALHEKFPNLNLMWLLYGNGEMFSDGKTDNSGELSGGQQSSNSPQQPHQQFLDFSADTNKQKAASQTPQNRQGVDYTLNISANSATKNIDKPIRRVTEIKVFYDDQTFDTFVLKK
ncbi:MAG: helix-turn-helix domain-containing protein [Prevotella sp.]|nr:helix-turn-helix domain-containing protein [Prevotella sp.]